MTLRILMVLTTLACLVGCETSTVTARVVDLAGQPVESATVEQLDNPLGATTDAEGVFALPWLGNPGVFRISAEGYLPTEISMGPTFRGQRLDEVVLWPAGAPSGAVCGLDLGGASVLTLTAMETVRRAEPADPELKILRVDLPAPVPELPVDRLAVFVDKDPHAIELFALEEDGAYVVRGAAPPETLDELHYVGTFPYRMIRVAELEPGLYVWAEVHRSDRSRVRDGGAAYPFRVTAATEDSGEELLATFRRQREHTFDNPAWIESYWGADLALLEQLGHHGAVDGIAAGRVARSYTDADLLQRTAEALTAAGRTDTLERLAFLYPAMEPYVEEVQP